MLLVGAERERAYLRDIYVTSHRINIIMHFPIIGKKMRTFKRAHHPSTPSWSTLSASRAAASRRSTQRAGYPRPGTSQLGKSTSPEGHDRADLLRRDLQRASTCVDPSLPRYRPDSQAEAANQEKSTGAWPSGPHSPPQGPTSQWQDTQRLPSEEARPKPWKPPLEKHWMSSPSIPSPTLTP